MRAVTTTGVGDADVLTWTDAPDPVLLPGEVLVEVAASAVNRADLLQRMGFYPPPPGSSEVIGLECSGRVVRLGAEVTDWQVGDEVCALLAGGGYAELVAVPAGQCMPVPPGVGLVDAAALPEVACTVWSNVVMLAGLREGEAFLVHGGASGIGTMAIQVADALGAEPILCTVRSAKAERCHELGADITIDYRDEDFVAVAREATGRGVDVILDIMGAAYLPRNLDALAPDGRLAVIGLQGGASAELDLGAMLRKRASLHATSLRSRPAEQKAAICAAVVEGLWPLVAAGAVRPIVDSVLPMAEAAEAHRRVEASDHVGKVLLVPGLPESRSVGPTSG